MGGQHARRQHVTSTTLPCSLCSAVLWCARGPDRARCEVAALATCTFSQRISVPRVVVVVTRYSRSPVPVTAVRGHVAARSIVLSACHTSGGGGLGVGVLSSTGAGARPRKIQGLRATCLASVQLCHDRSARQPRIPQHGVRHSPVTRERTSTHSRLCSAAHWSPLVCATGGRAGHLHDTQPGPKLAQATELLR